MKKFEKIYTISTTLIAIMMFACISCVPKAEAATLRVRDASTKPTTANTLEILLDTEGETINTIDGSIQISSSHSDLTKIIQSLSTRASAFTLWPNKPSLSKGDISFVGGVPNGIKGKDIILFTVMLASNDSTDISFSAKSVSGFLNDGQASKIDIKLSPASFVVSPIGDVSNSDLAKVIMEDKTPPKPFDIEVGRDDSIYDGKIFISFSTTDDDSGINRYEVIEGSNPVIRSGSPYVLTNQGANETITVIAVDNAGNIQASSIDLRSARFNWLFYVIVIILLIFAFYRMKSR